MLRCFGLEGVHYADGITSLSIGGHTLGSVGLEEEKKEGRVRGREARTRVLGKVCVCLCECVRVCVEARTQQTRVTSAPVPSS